MAMDDLDAQAAALLDRLLPRIERAATAAVEAAVRRQRQWRIMPGTIDPDSQRGAVCSVEPDDTPGEVVEVLRLDPRQGVPDGCDGDRLRTLVLTVPGGGGYALGILPDDTDDPTESPPSQPWPASVTASSSSLITGVTATSYGTTGTGYDQVAVAFVAGCTGVARVKVMGFLRNSTAAEGTLLGCVIREGATLGAGTVALAAADISAGQVNGTGSNTDGARVGIEFLAGGLVAGQVYNAQLEHRVTGGSGTVTRRTVIVSPDLGVALP